MVSRQLSEREAQTTFQKAVAQTVADYPFLHSNSADANTEAIADVVEWRDFYIAKGESPAGALQKAAAKVTQLYAGQADAAEPAAPTDKRKQAAIATGAKAAAAQPPRVDAGVGNRTIPVANAILASQDKREHASEAERMQFLQ